ncbi:antibiotic biosynthesis monooxygenase [Streptomyces sp. 900105245]
MSAGRNVAAAATAIIGQKVLPGMEREFETWQENLNAAAARYPGFLGAEISPPTPLQSDWVVVYRFDSVAHLQAWINSRTRQTYLDVGARYFDGPATQQVVSSGTRSPDPLVTVVVTHRVPPDQVDDFLDWQQRMVQEESKFEGFRGTELFRPVEGLQEEWTTLYRYDSAEHLDAWLTSPQRREILAEGEKFSAYRLHTIDNSFGSWFAFDGAGEEAPPPSETRTSLAIWVGLYPTVVLLTLALSPPAPAALDRPARGQPAVESPHELPDHALLREPAARALAAAAPARAGEQNQPPWPRHRRRRDGVLGPRLLPRHGPLVDTALTRDPPSLHASWRRSGQGCWALLHPAVLEYESSRSTTKTRVEPAGINGEGDCLP